MERLYFSTLSDILYEIIFFNHSQTLHLFSPATAFTMPGRMACQVTWCIDIASPMGWTYMTAQSFAVNSWFVFKLNLLILTGCRVQQGEPGQWSGTAFVYYTFNSQGPIVPRANCHEEQGKQLGTRLQHCQRLTRNSVWRQTWGKKSRVLGKDN